METQTINNLKNIKNTLLVSLETYRRFINSQSEVDAKAFKYGSEKEYNIKSLIAGVKNILTDITYLIRAHAFFIKISTYQERSNLYNSLNILNQYLINTNHTNLASQIDTLKVLIRPYSLRLDKDRFLEFSNEIDNLRRIAIDLESDISQVKLKIQETNDSYCEISEKEEEFNEVVTQILSKKEELEEKIINFTKEHEDSTLLAEKAIDNEQKIEAKLLEAESSQEQFNEFIDKINSMESLFKEQSIIFQGYNSLIEKYKEEQDKLKKQAEDLIEKSKQALEYTSSVGLSESFSNQYIKAKNIWISIFWLGGAFFFILVTMGLGVWILTDWGMSINTDIWVKVIGRLSLIPFTLMASIFCANQYTKQKYIIEDYAYKMVLSKSIIAFSEELREQDDERYAEYISTVLKEIHQDPLRERKRRKNKKEDLSPQLTVETLTKIAELVKSMIKN